LGQIEDLRLFAHIVENRSISKAAEKLNIAKSAVSRRLSLLEERFGARLIDRAPGVWEVTATGRELHQRASRVVSDVDDIESDFAEKTQNLSGPLTVSVPRDFGIAFLKPALLSFKRKYPDIQLTADFDDRVVDLTRENYDFAIRISPSVDANVVAQQIGAARHQLCASADYLNANGIPNQPQDLKEHSLLHFGTAKRAAWAFEYATGKKETIEFQPVLNSNNGEFLLNAAEAGLGIARLPDFITGKALAKRSLVALLPDEKAEPWKIYLAHSEDRRLNRRMRLFADETKIACSTIWKDIGT